MTSLLCTMSMLSAMRKRGKTERVIIAEKCIFVKQTVSTNTNSLLSDFNNNLRSEGRFVCEAYEFKSQETQKSHQMLLRNLQKQPPSENSPGQ